MVHLRIVAPENLTKATLEVVERSAAVVNIVVLRGAGRRPEGDVLLCDVAREEASVVIEDLRELGLPRTGSIAVETVETYVSDEADQAVEAGKGLPSDAVVWEEVEERTAESATLSFTFLAFMVIAALLAAVGIYLDSAVLIVGAMVVGPEFGPIAGFCVAIIQPPRTLALRSFVALAVGFPVAVMAVFWASLIFKSTGVTPDTFSEADHELGTIIATPDFFAAFVAFLAGIAGMLSLTTAKSGALIGVLISVTTIPAASNIGVSAAYADWPSFRGSATQLGVNLLAIVVAGTLTLAIQRAVYNHRRERHHREEVSAGEAEELAAGAAQSPPS